MSHQEDKNEDDILAEFMMVASFTPLAHLVMILYEKVCGVTCTHLSLLSLPGGLSYVAYRGADL